MKKWMAKNGWDSFNILLLLGIIWQLWVLFSPSPIIGLLSVKQPPRSLHGPQAVERATLAKMEQLGTPLNVEDIIRELHQNPDLLANNSTLKASVFPLLKRMQETQEKLLHSEERIQSIEEELNQLSLKMLTELSEEQKQELLERRNLDSVQKIEQKYWNELIQGSR